MTMTKQDKNNIIPQSYLQLQLHYIATEKQIISFLFNMISYCFSSKKLLLCFGSSYFLGKQS